MLKKFILSLCFSINLFSAYAAQPTIEEAQHSEILIETIRTYGCYSANGTHNAGMMSAALDFAQECATNFYCNQVMGQPSSERLGLELMSNVGSKERFDACPGATFVEIMGSCTASNAQEASMLIMEQWFGHDCVAKFHEYYAYVLVSTDQIPGFAGKQWFAMGLFSDDIPNNAPAIIPNEIQSVHNTPVITQNEIQPINGEAAHHNTLLIQAVKEIGGQSANGTENTIMLGIATDFAQECATNFYFNKVEGCPSSARLGKKMISHVGAKERFKSFPGRRFEEILATCTAYTAEEAVVKLAQGWFDSPGHKASMMPHHDHYAYALVCTDKIPGFAGYQWFAVGLFADN